MGLINITRMPVISKSTDKFHVYQIRDKADALYDEYDVNGNAVRLTDEPLSAKEAERFARHQCKLNGYSQFDNPYEIQGVYSIDHDGYQSFLDAEEPEWHSYTFFKTCMTKGEYYPRT